ncbi:GNAT family N-acetyltransferase [Streptomyces sp. NBC_00620]|uniref:GNAT family N-acetyltransferase n=1 Tax=unclassified Streptomyces TaxID=2593676 RepID=UPI002257461E|nr:GNAT family protein [Streptomyces sp. NBC_00620]MCX4971722.1 GNAT family N-acetyltransferase [Streptomyces sp. NBC_00620]WUC13759.1 GNAT family N-acetyltransferase [Streptomyces sp. NBC_00564]
MRDDVRIRDVQDADLELFYEQQLDAEAVRRSRFPSREREVFMNHWVTKVLGDSTAFVQTVTVAGEPAGNIVAWWDDQPGRQSQQDPRRFIGYWFGRPYWGRGIATEALTLFLRLEKNRPLYADPFTGNTASVRLLEKHGFQHTGTIRHGENEHAMLVLHELDEEGHQPGR